MKRRQEWLRESLVENDAEPLAVVGSVRLADDPVAMGQEMRRARSLSTACFLSVSSRSSWMSRALMRPILPVTGVIFGLPARD